MARFFDVAARQARLRFPGPHWDGLMPRERVNAIWEEIHRISTSGTLPPKAPPRQVDANLEQRADRVVPRRRRRVP
jgi:hypothetical protein